MKINKTQHITRRGVVKRNPPKSLARKVSDITFTAKSDYDEVEFDLEQAKEINGKYFGYAGFYNHQDELFGFDDLEPTTMYFAIVEVAKKGDDYVMTNCDTYFTNKTKAKVYLKAYEKNGYRFLSSRQKDRLKLWF
jgi:hypothetical protein